MVKTKGLQTSLKAAATPSDKYAATRAEIRELERKYNSYTWRAPLPTETVLSTSRGELCLSLMHFEAGLVLPLPKELVAFFNHFKMVPAMLTPNSITIILGLCRFFRQQSVPVTVANLMAMITLVSKDSGTFYCQVRRSAAFGMTGYANAYHHWKEKIVFASVTGQDWPIDTVVALPEVSVFKNWDATDAMKKMYREIGQTYLSLDVVTLAYQTTRPVKRKLLEEEAKEAEAPQDPAAPVQEVRKKRREEPSTAVARTAEEEVEVEIVASDSSTSGSGESTDGEEGGGGDEEEEDEEDELSTEETSVESSEEAVEASLPTPTRARVTRAAAALETSPARTGVSRPRHEGVASESPADAAAPRTSRLAAGRTSDASRPEDVDEASNEGREFWWNDQERVLTLRYNTDMRFVHDQLVSDIPDAVLECLTIPQDTAELRTYSEMDLQYLQSELAFSSALVGRYISRLSRDRGHQLGEVGEALRHHEEERKTLLARVTTLEAEVADAKKEGAAASEGAAAAKAEIAAAKAEVAAAKATLAEERIASQRRVQQLSDFGKAAVKQVEELKATPAAAIKERKMMEERLATERTSWDIERKSLRAEIEELTEGKARVAADAVATYKTSRDFLGEMSKFSLESFDMLKDALVVDGCLARSVVDTYDYRTCVRRDARGEFDVTDPK